MNRTARTAHALAAPSVLALALTGAVLTAPAAHADERVCRGTIGAGTIDGDVVVPPGASCTLAGTRIDGNVLVKGNATLVARGVRVGGNIQADDHRRVVVGVREVNGRALRSQVEGSIQLTQGGGGALTRVVVDSDIQLFGNDGRFVVRGNVVGGNLQCKSNTPRPTGGANRVEGTKEDQCRGL